jgi:hypothetical protein
MINWTMMNIIQSNYIYKRTNYDWYISFDTTRLFVDFQTVDHWSLIIDNDEVVNTNNA